MKVKQEFSGVCGILAICAKQKSKKFICYDLIIDVFLQNQFFQRGGNYERHDNADQTLYTYNWLDSQLFDSGGNPSNILKTSFEDDVKAEDTRKRFELKASQYLEEFDRLENEYDQQLISICGPDPANSFKPNLTDPVKGGGLLEQQQANVQIAFNGIDRVQRLMENVRIRIEIEQWRIAQIKGLTERRVMEIAQNGEKVADQQNSLKTAAYYYWNYSLRKEALGLTFDKPDGQGHPLTPVAQFQAYLRELRDDPRNILKIDGNPYVAIPFSTVKFNLAENADSAALPDSQGNSQWADSRPIFQDGLWDSKIDWVQVNVIGNNVYARNPQQMPVFLWYGGSSFVRTQNTYTAAAQGGQELDFLVYANQAYDFTYSPGSRGLGWKAWPYLQTRLTAKLVSNQHEIPDAVFKSEVFRERPVAATDWRLLIPANDVNIENIQDIELNLLYTARTRYSVWDNIVNWFKDLVGI